MRLGDSKKGYVFTNTEGEQVRLMRSNKGWYMRVRNKAGNYLDKLGNPGDRSSTHIDIQNR